MIYEYECEVCKAQVEVSRPAEERDAPITCPRDGVEMRRRISRLGGLVFVGKGWAKDGYSK